MAVRIDHGVTSGTFTLDAGTWYVDNNFWVIGDDEQCVVIDAPHDSKPILAAVGTRQLVGILLTHAHDDHISAAQELSRATGAPVYLHPADGQLWDLVYPDLQPDRDLADGDVIEVAGVQIHVLHTPGHAPGAVCFYVPALETIFTGDTLFSGGPGATGRSFSDFPTIIESIETRLLTLPPDTVVRTGHGETTTIGAEAPDLPDWVARGH